MESRCTGSVVPACHNATDSVTVAGTREDISNFVQKLKEEGHFAKEVDSAGIAFHSQYMEMPSKKFKANISDVSVCNIQLRLLFHQTLIKRCKGLRHLKMVLVFNINLDTPTSQ